MGISIKYKLLFILVTIPMAALTIYLALATQVFTDDKMAYVFDSSSNVSRTMAAQARAELETGIAALRPLWEGFLTDENKFSESAIKSFERDPSTRYAALFFPGSPQFQMVKDLEKEDPSEGFLKTAQTLIEKSQISGLAVSKFENSSELLVFCIRLNEKDPKKSPYLIALRKASELISSFQKKSTNSVFLVDHMGEIIFSSDKNFKDVQSFADWEFFVTAQKNKTPQSVSEIKNPKSQELLISSYAQSGIGQMAVVTLVQKSKALEAVKILLSKSLLFFIAIISASVVISVLASGGLTRAITELYEATKKVSEGHFDVVVNVNSKDEVGGLAASFSHMAGEVSRLMAASVIKARMEKELETAKTVQETLFPKTGFSDPRISIQGLYEPASECGGDWWHYCIINEKMYIWIGDATGHGVAAALITSAAKSAASVIQRLGQFSTAISPVVALDFLNRAICDTSQGKMMMTFFLAAIDLKTGDLTYCNASHDPPYLLKRSKDPLTKDDLILLNEVKDPRLGQSPEVKFKEANLKLDEGDTLFFYTDGIIDIVDPKGKTWGERSLIKVALRAANNHLAPATAIEQISEDVSQFRQGTPMKDDITLVMCQIHKTA